MNCRIAKNNLFFPLFTLDLIQRVHYFAVFFFNLEVLVSTEINLYQARNVHPPTQGEKKAYIGRLVIFKTPEIFSSIYTNRRLSVLKMHLFPPFAFCLLADFVSSCRMLPLKFGCLFVRSVGGGGGGGLLGHG